MVFNLSVTLGDAPGWLFSFSVIPRVPWFHRVKNRGAAASLAESISLMLPDVIVDVHTIFIRVRVCAFFVFHLAEVIPQFVFITCQMD